MADDTTRNDRDRIDVQDVVQVGSRVSWGAILAGTMVAIAVFFLLAALGTAIGMQVRDSADADNMATGALIWGIASAVVSLFVGGFITSQFTVGEKKSEAVIYGLIVWGVVSLVLLHLTASGLNTGAQVMTGVSRMESGDWRDAARQAGVSQEQIANWDRMGSTGQPANDSTTAASDDGKKAAWAAFGGTLLCLIAAVVGAIVGAGPKLLVARAGTVHPDGGRARPASA